MLSTYIMRGGSPRTAWFASTIQWQPIAARAHGQVGALGSRALAAWPCCLAISRSRSPAWAAVTTPLTRAMYLARCSWSCAIARCFLHSSTCAWALMSAGRVPGA